MYKSNYDKFPAILLDGVMWKGWDCICNELKKTLKGDSFVLVIECYQGVFHDELCKGLAGLSADKWIDTQTLFKSAEDIEDMTYPFVTDDRLFGFRTTLSIEDFFDSNKLAQAREDILDAKGVIVVYGHGAAFVAPQSDCLV